MSKSIITCRSKRLPQHLADTAAMHAIQQNPANHVRLEQLARLLPGVTPTKQFLAALRTAYWGASGVSLTVAFLDPATDSLKKRILSHMNAWNEAANVKFVESQTDPQVRIAFTPNDGYWSYVGTEILAIPRTDPTMNLESFSDDTPDSEFHRVVRHETGHTLGFVHEHMRRELVKKIDPEKAYKYFADNDGWSKQEVDQQVLTPVEESSLLGNHPADPNSIMCYQIPGEITRNGEPIAGGLDIDNRDFELAAKLYPQGAASAPAKATNGTRHHDAPMVFVTSDNPAYLSAVLSAVTRS